MKPRELSSSSLFLPFQYFLGTFSWWARNSLELKRLNWFLTYKILAWNVSNELPVWQIRVLMTFTGFMGFKLFKRVTSKDSTAIRRGSFRFSLRRRSRLSREDTRNSQNGDASDVLRPRRAGDGQSAEARTSKEVGSALRAIGDDLNNSTLSLHSAT